MTTSVIHGHLQAIYGVDVSPALISQVTDAISQEVLLWQNRGHFLSDEAMFKLIYMALKNIVKKLTMPIRDWKSALNQISIIFDSRMSLLR